MNARSLAATLLLVAAAFCVVHVTLDGEGLHLHQAQWRASTHYLEVGHLPGRSTMGVPVPSAPLTVTSAVGQILVIDPPELLPPFLRPVFVPPRA